MSAMAELMAKFVASGNPASAVDAAFDEAIAELVEKLRKFDPVRLIEVARLTFLPMAPEGVTPVTADASAALVELLALIALSVQDETTSCVPADDPVKEQEMGGFVSDAKEKLDSLLHLAQMRTFITVDPNDKLTMVSLLIRASEVLMRNPSYPTMSEATNHELFDRHPIVHTALKDGIGFDASQAQAVLNGCHQLQQVGMNDRMDAMRRTTLRFSHQRVTDANWGHPERCGVR